MILGHSSVIWYSCSLIRIAGFPPLLFLWTIFLAHLYPSISSNSDNNFPDFLWDLSHVSDTEQTLASVCSIRVLKFDCLLYKLRGFSVMTVGRLVASNSLLLRLIVIKFFLLRPIWDLRYEDVRAVICTGIWDCDKERVSLHSESRIELCRLTLPSNCGIGFSRLRLSILDELL